MNQKNLKWLIRELPRLVQQNIITADQQNAIIDFYEYEKKNKPNIALIAFSIFGAILLASGIILILAHNWPNLSRSLRTVLSFLPLLIGQCLGFRVLLTRQKSIAWCEGISVFTFLAIGSTIALISQTYHIQGELRNFLLTWVVLAIPLVYLFNSTASSVLYLIGISSWVIVASQSGSSALAYWLLFIGIIPFYLLKHQKNKSPKQAIIIEWFMALSLIAGVLVGHVSITEGFRAITFVSLFLSLYIIGEHIGSGRSPWSSPFRLVGILGLSVTYLFFSFRDNWKSLSYDPARSYRFNSGPGLGDWTVSIVILLLAVCLLVMALRDKSRVTLGVAAGLPLALLGFAFTDSSAGQSTFTALFNLYVFTGGIAYMVIGIKSNVSRTVNFGFALIAAVIILRFFDSDLSFVLRGIIFVILGIGFLSTNIIIVKRRAV